MIWEIDEEEMKTLYDINYVAFLDILGFSKYVSDEDNVDKVDNLFKFAKRFCLLYNTSPKLKVYASFFFGQYRFIFR